MSGQSSRFAPVGGTSEKEVARAPTRRGDFYEKHLRDNFLTILWCLSFALTDKSVVQFSLLEPSAALKRQCRLEARRSESTPCELLWTFHKDVRDLERNFGSSPSWRPTPVRADYSTRCTGTRPGSTSKSI